MSGRRRKKQSGSSVWMVVLVIVIIGFFWYSHHSDGTQQPDSIATPVENSEPETPLGDVSVHYIDVGQGDSILIQSPDGSMLIDAGEKPEGDTVEAYLKQQGVSELDYVVATHPHSDHIGGLTQIIEDFPVKNIIMPKASNNTATYEHLLTAMKDKGLKATPPTVDDTFNIGGMKFTVLAPNSSDHDDLNDYSVVLRMDYGERSFLFTGDASKPSEDEMLENGLPLKADFLKVGHHGSSTASSPDFLDAVQPIAAFISCGVDNDYGHPHEETMEKLNERGISVYRTDEQGSIVVGTDGKDYTITTVKK